MEIKDIEASGPYVSDEYDWTVYIPDLIKDRLGRDDVSDIVATWSNDDEGISLAWDEVEKYLATGNLEDFLLTLPGNVFDMRFDHIKWVESYTLEVEEPDSLISTQDMSSDPDLNPWTIDIPVTVRETEEGFRTRLEAERKARTAGA